jgi:hypothetical protein
MSGGEQRPGSGDSGDPGPGARGQGGEGAGAPGSGPVRIVYLPTAREALATLGASVVSLVTGYLVLFVSDLSGWLGVAMLAAGVGLFGLGVRAALEVQRHYDEGGRVAASSRVLIWIVAALAGGGSLGVLLLAGALVVSLAG